MPEVERDGGAILDEAAQQERKELDEARASLAQLLEHERTRRRNRWLFYLALILGALVLLPVVALYVALVVKLALSLG